MFNIVSWNINGIRSSQQNLKDLFDSLNADVIFSCFLNFKLNLFFGVISTRLSAFKRLRLLVSVLCFHLH